MEPRCLRRTGVVGPRSGGTPRRVTRDWGSRCTGGPTRHTFLPSLLHRVVATDLGDGESVPHKHLLAGVLDAPFTYTSVTSAEVRSRVGPGCLTSFPWLYRDGPGVVPTHCPSNHPVSGAPTGPSFPSLLGPRTPCVTGSRTGTVRSVEGRDLFGASGLVCTCGVRRCVHMCARMCAHVCAYVCMCAHVYLYSDTTPEEVGSGSRSGPRVLFSFFGTPVPARAPRTTLSVSSSGASGPETLRVLRRCRVQSNLNHEGAGAGGVRGRPEAGRGHPRPGATAATTGPVGTRR